MLKRTMNKWEKAWKKWDRLELKVEIETRKVLRLKRLAMKAGKAYFALKPDERA